MTRPPITDIGITKPTVEDETCDCPAGAWHRRDCTLVYWPEHMRETPEEDGDE